MLCQSAKAGGRWRCAVVVVADDALLLLLLMMCCCCCCCWRSSVVVVADDALLFCVAQRTATDVNPDDAVAYGPGEFDFASEVESLVDTETITRQVCACALVCVCLCVRVCVCVRACMCVRAAPVRMPVVCTVSAVLRRRSALAPDHRGDLLAAPGHHGGDGLGAWSNTPIRDTSCRCYPLTVVPYLRARTR